MKWEDATSYSRGQEHIPTAWATTIGPEVGRIFVTSSHRDYPGQWIMHCYRLGIDTLLLDDSPDTAQEAQAIALVVVRAKVQAMMDELAAIGA